MRAKLKYLQVIRQLRDRAPDTFEQIKRLPKKARTAENSFPSFPRWRELGRGEFAGKRNAGLLTFFRKGKLQKFCWPRHIPPRVGFLRTARIFEADNQEARAPLGADFFDLLDLNGQAFDEATLGNLDEETARGGRDSAAHVLRILKTNEIEGIKVSPMRMNFTLNRVVDLLETGGLPKQTTKTLLKVLDRELKKNINPIQILALLRLHIAPEFFKATMAETAAQTFGPREVILSEYLVIPFHSKVESDG